MPTQSPCIQLIEQIHKHLPAEYNAASLLADTLQIGKEAVYRRLRGEVEFSFSEAAQIACRLNISLDDMAYNKPQGSALFRLGLTDFEASVASYEKVIEIDTAILHNMRGVGCELTEAGNQIPQSLYMKYENLSNFKLFKWLYQHDVFRGPFGEFNRMILNTSHLSDRYKNFISSVHQIETTHFIFDNTICQHWVQAIRFFSDLHLLSQQDIDIMRNEMTSLLNELEEINVTGRLHNGKRILIYVSELDIEANYTYLVAPGHNIARIAVYSLNSIRTEDIGMVQHMHKWVQSLRKFSTLITQSSELQRHRFFNQQREVINSL